MANRAAKLRDVVSYRNAIGETTDVVVTGIQGAAPVAGDFTVTPSATGGDLPDATYSYKVTAVVDGVETPASVAETGVVAASSGNGSVTINFTVGLASFPTATAWKVYGRTDAAWEFIATVTAPTATYVDDGAETPDGEPPAATNAVAFRNRGTKVTQTDVPMATTAKQTGAYFNR